MYLSYDQARKVYESGQADGIGIMADTEKLKETCEQLVRDGFATREEGNFYALTEKGMQYTKEHWGNGKDSPQVPIRQASIHLNKRPLIEQVITKERILSTSKGPSGIHTNDNPKFDMWELSAEGSICIHCYTQEGTQLEDYRAYHQHISHTLGSIQNKYRWMPSAALMTSYLMDSKGPATVPFESPILHNPIWIEFEHPSAGVQALLLTSHTVHALPDPAGTWLLILFDATGEEGWNICFSFDGHQIFIDPSPFYICGTGECQPLEDNTWKFCDTCKEIATTWLHWLSIVSLMLEGAFQEQEVRPEIEEVIEKTIRKVPRQDKPHKFTEQQIEHRYRVIRFDASMHKARRKQAVQEPRSSWVEEAKAINPDAIVYVSRHIGKTERTFRHACFVHKRGQTINVRAHDKRIPMKVSELRKKITRVVASKFEQADN